MRHTKEFYFKMDKCCYKGIYCDLDLFNKLSGEQKTVRHRCSRCNRIYYVGMSPDKTNFIVRN